MTYVFFDCECANCLAGQGKICSLGYVKTDSALSILKKKDILMNPDAPFLLGNAKNGNGIRLAYPLFRFRNSRTFPSDYEEIKALFSHPDTLVFGFAVTQDVSYLAYTCQRYHLPFFDFKFYDIQLLEKILHHRSNPSGLDSLIAQYHLNASTFHRSDDDAYMTLEVLRGILNENKMTIPELLEAYPEPLCDTQAFLKVIEQRRVLYAKKKAYREKMNRFYDEINQIDPILGEYDDFFWKKTFYFDYKLFGEDFAHVYSMASPLRKKGGRITRNPREADYVIVQPGKKLANTITLKEGSQYLDVPALNEHLVPKKTAVRKGKQA
jgi:hypothetical protein